MFRRETKGGEKMNLRDRPYLEVEVVEVKVKKERRKEIPKTCVDCEWVSSCYRDYYKKLEKEGTWVNGENLDKIEFPFFCTFGVGSRCYGMVIKTIMDYQNCDTAYLLFSIDGQIRGITSIDRDLSLKHLIEIHNINVLKGKIILFKEIK